MTLFPQAGREFLVRCPDTEHTGTNEFAAPAAELARISEDGTTIVYLALCPQGHSIEIDPDVAMIDLEVRAGTQALANFIGSGRIRC